MNYEDVPFSGVADAEAAILRNAPEELLRVPIAVSLYADDFEWAQELCFRLASHPHPTVRGSALLGLGHLARRWGRIDSNRTPQWIEAGLRDADPFVRGQAENARDDIETYANPIPKRR